MKHIVNHIKELMRRSRRGIVLIISMIFILIFSALAVSMATLSGVNLQLADNQHKVNTALSTAQSGLEIMRYWLDGITLDASVAPSDRVQEVASQLQTKLTNGAIVSYNSTNQTAAISGITLDSQTNQQFSAAITYDSNNGEYDYDTLLLNITGTDGPVSRRISVNFDFAPVGNNVFDYAIATRGPLRMNGNVDIEGLNEAVEASVYIESNNENIALEMVGKSAVAGNVGITNAIANVDIGNASSVGGAQGEAAMEYVIIGTTASEFPTPNPADFEQYIQNTFDPNTDTTTSLTLKNIRIPGNTNPQFSGDITIQGIIFIETPNITRFSGNTEITGIIIANGSIDLPSSENKIEFTGNVNSYSVSELPDAEFSELKKKTGTFLLAPGFSASFGGNFNTLNGVIAASGISFSGNAGGTINGSIVNYGDTAMTFSGNANLIFNRSGIQANPAGFGSGRILQFVPTSYSEPTL